MNASVGNQSTRAPHLVTQTSEALVRCPIEPHLVAKLFRIKRPTLDKRGEAAIAAERRQAGALLLQGKLQVVTWLALMEAQDRDLVKWRWSRCDVLTV